VRRRFSTVSRRAEQDVRRVGGGRLNDLFSLFPELPRFQHRPLVEQYRRRREKIERVQRQADENIARHRAAAARGKASWLAKRRA
jgi:hypothetical protein